MKQRGIHKYLHVFAVKKTHAEDESTGWRLLANAIILQAIRDYRYQKISKAQFINFLRSDYFTALSRGVVSADAIIQEVVDNGRPQG